jgi:thiol:disulfide interchange protein
MNRFAKAWRPLAALLVVFSLHGAVQAQLGREEKAKVQLSSAPDATPGSTATLVATMTIEKDWHTNSHEPTLDYLIPTVATFEVSAGWSVTRVEYPEGHLLRFAFVDEPISVFEGEVKIRASLTVPAGAHLGPVPVAVSIRYQACNDTTCLAPVKTRAEGFLNVVATTAAPEAAAAGPSFGLQRSGARGAAGEGAATAEGIPPAAKDETPEDLSQQIHEETAETAPTATAATAATTPPPDESSPPAPGAASSGPGEAGEGRSLLSILLLGLVGGLILNVMPCVLPVLSLKVFSLVKSAGQGRSEVVRGSLLTSLGILSSFWALALAALLARTAGRAVGWGVQFQEPGFVAFLAVVIVLFSLNLWGLFEIPMPARLANRLAGGGPREGAAGHFASGLFATLMATPCSAPFLGTAISFALGQPPVGIVAVFTSVGLGMSLPYLLLAVWPQAANLLPRPGAWMETLRGAMGFLLAAGAIWLFFVLASQVDPARLAFIQMAMLALALCVWLASRPAGVAKSLKALATAGALAAAVGTIALAATAAPYTPGTASSEEGDIAWTVFDQAQAEQLAAEGTPVFVDVTANWCVTCKVVERGVLAAPEVAAAFHRNGVVAMKADWTNYDEEIGTFLQEHGRAGIPFYLLYRPKAEPYLFSELPTRGSIIEVLDALPVTDG